MTQRWQRYLAAIWVCLLTVGLFSVSALADTAQIVLPAQGPGEVTVQEAGQPSLELNGKRIDLTAEVVDGDLYLPLRAIVEALGFRVDWFGETEQVTLSGSGTNIELFLEDAKIQANGHELYTLNYRMLNDRTYVSEDFFADELGLDVDWSRSEGKAALTSVVLNPIVIENQREFSETQTLKSTVQYPELDGLSDPGVQQKLNTLFAGLAASAKEEGLQNEKDLPPEATTRNIKAETYFNYQVKYNHNGILSLVFSDYQYSGGAHGMTVQSSYTFDLKTGNEYELKDLFQDGVDYVSVISEQVKQQMQERDMTVLLNPFNAIKADQDFYLTSNSVVVYFQQYEYLPYAFGIPEFAIDFASLRDLFNEDFAFLDASVSQNLPGGE